jgi:lipopolysaccharide export system permease protein
VGENQSGVMHDFWLWELDDQGRVKRLIRADTGRFEYEEATHSFVLTLHHAQVEARSEKNPENFAESPLVGSFEESAATRLSLERFFGRSSGARMKQEWLTYELLQAERRRLAALPTPADPAAARKAALDRLKLDLIFHDKINLSLAVLALTLIGVPLGIRVSRRETSANFGVAVGVTLTYYLMTVAIKGLDQHPELRPDLLLWLPNGLLIGLGGWLMMRIERR